MNELNTEIDPQESQLFAEDFLIERADKGQRLANYIIDLIFVYVIIFVVGFIVGIFYYSSRSIEQYNEYTPTSGNQDGAVQLLLYLAFLVSFIIVYTLLEGGLKGKTIGKYITKTRAVKLDGSKITWKDALLRSLSRIVPFEPFSGLGDNLWHDSWTNTMVVKEKSLLKQQN